MKPEMRTERQMLRSNECDARVVANALGNFFTPTWCVNHNQHDKRETGLFKEEFKCTEMFCLFCLCSKTYCRYEATSNNYIFGNEKLNNFIQSNQRF